MTNDSSNRLKSTIRRLLDRNTRRDGWRDTVTPGCAFGSLVEQRLRYVERELQETRGRVNGLLFLLVALVTAEVIISIVG